MVKKVEAAGYKGMVAANVGVRGKLSMTSNIVEAWGETLRDFNIICDPQYTETGVGAAKGKGGAIAGEAWFYCQIYARPK